MNYITYRNTYSKKIKHIFTEAIIHYNGNKMRTIAMWDTGAYRSHITEDIIDAFECESIGEDTSLCHSGLLTSTKHQIHIELPTRCIIKDIIVASTSNMKYKEYDIGVLIGMDIIQCGDFHIDNTGEKTVFTFRHPYDGDEDKLIETELF